jgi:hypothetical protein
VCLQEDDLKRCEAIQADLRKPQTSRIRCIECLYVFPWPIIFQLLAYCEYIQETRQMESMEE